MTQVDITIHLPWAQVGQKGVGRGLPCLLELRCSSSPALEHQYSRFSS